MPRAKPEQPQPGKRVTMIVARRTRGQALCRALRPETFWFEPSGLSCGAKSARKAIEAGLVVPLDLGLFGDGASQTYGVPPC